MKRKTFFAVFILVFGIYWVEAQQNQRLISQYIQQHFAEFNSPNAGFVIDSEEYSKSLKADVVKIQQQYKQIPIYNAVSTAVVRDGKVIYFTENFEKFQSSSTAQSNSNPQELFIKTAKEFGLNDVADYQFFTFSESENSQSKFVKYRPMYFNKNAQLYFCYEFIFEDHHQEFWSVLTDIKNGEILFKQNLTLNCQFLKEDYAHHTVHSRKNTDSEIQFQNKLADNSSYNVFPLPIESPNFGSRSLVSNPWYNDASPEGWHFDGTEHYTITRGNNVFAYEDQNTTDQVGFSPNGGNSRVFDFPLNLNAPHQTNLSAAITNLFYTSNKAHDLFYRLGFTETSRNFQTHNFGKGGTGNDPVLAEAQDGEGFDNATFSSTPDGTSPRLQMYLWTPTNIRRLFYNQPASAIMRQPISRPATFGPALTPTGITADVAIASVLDACTVLPANSMVNKIGLAERGNCNFTVKVKNIQNAGGIGAIIYNATNSANFFSMGGDDPTITIPSILIENSEGEFIKTTINSATNVNVTLKHDSSQDVYIDASFDNGIIVHEYTHGVTNRNTGNGYSCLNKEISKEQMGEGWSDFFALMFTNTDQISAATPRSVATFSAGQDANGNGIRPAKYSPDFTVNNVTYSSTNGQEFEEDGEMVPNVHAIGFVWASMLWDLHWKFVEKYGYVADAVNNPNSGSGKVVQLVMDALKIQECNPTFISGRDAILYADLLANNGENRCMIWETFARRGLGIDAASGYKNSINDQTEDFKTPLECQNSQGYGNEYVIVPNPVDDSYFDILIPVSDFGKVAFQIYDASGRVLISEERLVVQSRQRFSSFKLKSGVYLAKVNGKNGEKVLKFIVSK